MIYSLCTQCHLLIKLRAKLKTCFQGWICSRDFIFIFVFNLITCIHFSSDYLVQKLLSSILYFTHSLFTNNFGIHWTEKYFISLNYKQETALAALLRKYLVVRAVRAWPSRTRFETRCAPAMGSNCCKGDAAGKPLVRSSSSIYNRYLWLAIIILQEYSSVPWVLRMPCPYVE